MRILYAFGILTIVASAASPATAGPSSIIQNSYWGGLDTYYGYAPSTNNGQSIGGDPFTINDSTASRSSNGKSLTVTINTAYAGQSGTDGTVYGDLLLNPTWRAASDTVSQLLGNWQYGAAGNGTNAATDNDSIAWNDYSKNIIAATNTTNKLGDIWQPGDWHYAVTDGAKGWGLYKITDSQIVLSSAPGCSDTWPIQSNCGWFYRAGEAVQVQNTTTAEFLGAATMTVVNDQSITYTFTDNGLLGDDFAMSWAMTCANDIIQGEFNVPAPGSLALLSIGLLGIAMIRRHQNATKPLQNVA